MPYDLFGEIPVTLEDLKAWLRAVPKIDPDSPRALQYAKDWAIVDKIKAAKLAGNFENIVDPPSFDPGQFGVRFSWVQKTGRIR